jgi:hypothetical protein
MDRVKSSDAPRLFKSEKGNFAFYWSKDRKVTLTYSGWDQSKVVLEGQVLELWGGPQGAECRIVDRPRRGKRAV